MAPLEPRLFQQSEECVARVTGGMARLAPRHTDHGDGFGVEGLFDTFKPIHVFDDILRHLRLALTPASELQDSRNWALQRPGRV